MPLIICSKKVMGFFAAATMIVSCSMLANADESKGKVAVVDLQRAVMTTTVAREQMKALELQKDYAETRKKAEALQADMEKKVAEAKKEGPTWSAEKQAGYSKDMEFMQKDLELAGQKIQSQNQELLRRVMKDMEPKLKQVLQQIIETDKLSVVIHKDAVIFAGPDADITEKVTEKLNALK